MFRENTNGLLKSYSSCKSCKQILFHFNSFLDKETTEFIGDTLNLQAIVSEVRNEDRIKILISFIYKSLLFSQ